MIFRTLGCFLLLISSLQPLVGQKMAHPPDEPIYAVLDSVTPDISVNSTEELMLDSTRNPPVQGRKPPLKRLNVFGYYRLFMYGRNMTNPYPGLAPFEQIVAGVGDGYREPMLSVTLAGRPNGRSAFGTELYFFTPYAGNYQDNVFTLNLGVSMYGSFRTDFGKFGIRAGGINWYSISPFTLGTFQILDRYSIFERTPWEGVTHTDKYDNYYSTGSVSRDTRWGFAAFQGFIFEGGDLPGGFSFKALYGKTQPNGGLFNLTTDNQGMIGTRPAPTSASIINPGVNGNVPNYFPIAGGSRFVASIATAGQLRKDFGENYIAYNTMYSRTFLDTVADVKRGFHVNTLSYDFMVKKIRLTGEMGVGRYFTPDETSDWGEALMLRLNFPKEYTFLPLEIQLYQIDKNFFNNNSEIQTFSNPKFTTASFGTGVNQAGQAGTGNSMPITGQLAHNRRGANVSAKGSLGALNLEANYGVAQELEALSGLISYDHRVNGLALSRIYNPFPLNATGPTIVGPYSRKVTYFRGTFETVQTTDLNPITGAPLNRKYFVSAEIVGKYKTEILKHPFYAFYLGSWQSVNNQFSLTTSLNENTYVFSQYHELDLYYELFPNFMLAGYLGLERIRGGQDTNWDIETALPRNQIGQAFALGFDWTISKGAGIFLRHRRMRFEDRSFSLDQFAGHETTFELKIFF